MGWLELRALLTRTRCCSIDLQKTERLAMLTTKFPHPGGDQTLSWDYRTLPRAHHCTTGPPLYLGPPLMAVCNPNIVTHRRAGDIDGPHDQGG